MRQFKVGQLASGSYNISGSFSGSFQGNLTGTSSYAQTALNAPLYLPLTGGTVTGNVTILGTASINTLVVNQTVLSTGSNQLGDAANDTQTLYGTVRIPTGSLTVTGSTIISSSAATQLQVGTNALFVSSSGAVGIGTSSPTNTLDVTGSVRFRGSATIGGSNYPAAAWSNYLTIGIDGTDKIITGYLSSSTNGAVIGAHNSALNTWSNLNVVGSNIVFRRLGEVEAMRVNSSSNVLIGTPTDTGHRFVSIGAGASGSVNLDSTLYVSGSRVGIGISSPAGKLDLYDSTNTFLYVRTGAVGANWQTAGVQSSIGTYTNHPLAFKTNDVGRMRIESNGNVLIGTTTDAGFKLDVNGTARVSGSASTALTLTQGASGDAIVIENGGYIQMASTRFRAFGTGFQFQDNAYDIKVALSMTSFSYFNSGANYSLGTTIDSGARFTVRGSGATTATTALRVENTNASASLVVNDAGNVGIGTPSPSASLDIVGNVRIVTTPSAGNIVRPDNVGAAFQFGNGTNTAYGEFRFKNTGGTDIGRLLENGNFGIGLITPSASLHISGASSANLLRIDSPTSSSILFVSGSGNVGIGTSNPITPLDIVSTDGRGLRITNVGGGQNAILITNASSLLRWSNGSYISQNAFYTQANNTEFITFDGANVVTRLFIQASNGFVGIGTQTTTPTSRLQVRGSGATSATTALRVENTNASASLVVLDNGNVYSNGPGFIASNTAFGFQSLNNPSGSATQNTAFGYQNFSANNYAGYDNIAIGYRSIQNATTGYQNMGIGTETLQNLTVGAANTAMGHSVLRFATANTTNTGIGYYSLYTLGANQGNTNTGIGSYAFQVMTTGSNNIGIGAGSSTFKSGSLNIFIGASTNQILTGSGNVIIGNNQALPSSLDNTIAISDGSGNMRIYVSSSGNVGIGTTLPVASLHISGAASSTLLIVTSSAATALFVSGSGNVGIGTATPGQTLSVVGNAQFGFSSISAGARLHTRGAGVSSTSTSFRAENFNGFPALRITDDLAARFDGVVGIQRAATASLDVAGTTRISGSFNTAASGSILTIIGSGSTQPIFTVQGSQGELFSITDSLTGSLFSVNDISGLPILEVFSDNTTLIGNYQDPMLITTAKVVQTNSGSFTMYSLPTASYDTAFFEYSIRSGSNARAGTIMAMQLGSAVNFTETTTTDFGSTSAVSFIVIVTGSNMALTGSSTSGAWTIKTIVRGI